MPKARRRGAASLSLQWGMEKADEMRVKSFIEATIEGTQLYEKFGFITKEIMDVKREDMEQDSEWMALAQEYPLRYRWMEREKRSSNA